MMLIADLDTIIPVGTVTGMLVAIFIAFMRDSARKDRRVDDITKDQIVQLRLDRDEAIRKAIEADREKDALEVALRAEIAKLTSENITLRLRLSQYQKERD